MEAYRISDLKDPFPGPPEHPQPFLGLLGPSPSGRPDVLSLGTFSCSPGGAVPRKPRRGRECTQLPSVPVTLAGREFPPPSSKELVLLKQQPQGQSPG